MGMFGKCGFTVLGQQRRSGGLYGKGRLTWPKFHMSGVHPKGNMSCLSKTKAGVPSAVILPPLPGLPTSSTAECAGGFSLGSKGLRVLC